MKHFTAAEALNLSKKTLTDGERVNVIINQITEKIKEACLAGRRSITDPFRFYNYNDPKDNQRFAIIDPSVEEEKATKEKLVAMGYTWQSHPDPDPGHPCSRPYETLSW